MDKGIGPAGVLLFVDEQILARLAMDPRPIDWYELSEMAGDALLLATKGEQPPSERLVDVFLDWLSSEERIRTTPSKTWMALNAEWISWLNQRLEESGYRIGLLTNSANANEMLAALDARGINAEVFERAAKCYGMNNRDSALQAYHFLRSALEHTAKAPGRILLIVNSTSEK